MVSKRIKLIASLLDVNDTVLDIGTDHALLPIYLCENKLVKLVDASDISAKVLDKAKDNISKNNLLDKISLYLSDGLKNIDTSKYNTLVICGMGYFTIHDILDNGNLDTINKMIIQTNNHYEDMRRYIISHNYSINKEIWINDQNIDYIIFDVKRGKQVLSDDEIICGIYNPLNYEFYNKEITKYTLLLNEIPSDLLDKINYINHVINIYKSYIIRYKTEEKSN